MEKSLVRVERDKLEGVRLHSTRLARVVAEIGNDVRRENELMLLENLVTRRVSEENASNSSLTCRVTKQGHLLLAALGPALGCNAT